MHTYMHVHVYVSRGRKSPTQRSSMELLDELIMNPASVFVVAGDNTVRYE